MKNLIPSSSALLKGALFLVALFGFAATPAYSAGSEPSTSAYATIQPNAAGTHFVYTVSWVAPDTMFLGGTGVPYIYSGPYANGSSTMDSPLVFSGNNYTFDNTGNGGAAATTVLIKNDTYANTAASVKWRDPMVTTLTTVNPNTATPKWDDLGDFLDLPDLAYGSGIQGITGFLSLDPNGSGASTGTGVGIYTDEDGGLGGVVDDIGLLLSGYTDVTTPKRGHVQVVVPMPTTLTNPQHETATVKAADFQVETLELNGDVAAAVAQVETATVVAPSNITTAGNVSVTVTGALITGSPLVVTTANVALNATATTVATAIKTAMNVAAITTNYTVGGTGATVTLTKKATITANDGTLNIAIANGTCAGITTAPTSLDTTAGYVGGGGILNIIVTATGMSNSPKTVPVTVTAGSNTTTQATAVRSALNADPDVAPFFTATGSGKAIILTRDQFAANDPMMNLGSFPSTCTGPKESDYSGNTVLGGSITAGDVAVTVDGVDINGGVQLEVNVTLLANETSASAATKISNALNALPAITTFYTASVVNLVTVRLTRTGAPTTFHDNNLNIAIANGTTTGVVAKPKSAGVGQKFTDVFFPGTYLNNGSIELVVTTDSSYVPKIAVSGDFNSDLAVNATDLAVPALAANFTGVGVTGKWYRKGDTNSDGDVDNADLGYVIGAFAAAPGTPSAATGSATLTYDPITGNVKLDATAAGGLKITSFQLQTSAATIVTANYSPVTGGTFNGTYKNVTTSVIGDTDTSLAGVTGAAIDLGNVFPTGMTLPGLTSYLTTAVYTGASGSRQQNLTLALAPAVATVDNFLISAIASPQTVGTAITGITITARDATNAPFTGFTGTVTFGGSGGFSGASGTFTLGELSGVSVTPANAGSNLTFTVTDPVSGKTGSATITTVQTRYAAWSGGALVNIDTNSDGVLNGVAWVVGAANPSASATALQPTSDITTDPNFLTFTYRRTDAAKIDANTTIAVEYGSDLSGWTTAVHDGTNIIITPADDGAGVGIDLVQVKIKKTLAVGSSLFARLKVVITP